MTASAMAAHAEPQPDARVIRQAAHWLARLQADDSPAAAAACLAWRRARPQHELAWQRMHAMAGQFSATGIGPDTRLASDALHRIAAQESRRQKLKWLLGLAGAGAVAWMTDSGQIVRTQLADHRTATGQRDNVGLSDGTQVALNTRSAMDVQFSDHQRLLALRGGEIYVQTAPDSLGRPLLVQTRAGVLAPVGTRFLVRELDERDAVRVTVLEGEVDIRLADGVTRVVAGQRCDYQAGGASLPQAAGRSAAAWLNGMLVVDRMPLREFLRELNRYRPGSVGCDDSLADLPVAGAFSIDDTDATLDLLSRTLPVRLSVRTRYWVRVMPA